MTPPIRLLTISRANTTYLNRRRKTRRQVFLEHMDRILPWDTFVAVLRKATRSRKLNCADQFFNRKSNRTRARVEHVFGVIKHQWGYRKVRYRGLQKNTAPLYSLFALANFHMAGDRLLAL